MTMIAGSATPRSWPYLRATLIDASVASRPELQKKTSSRPVISATRSAAASWVGMRQRFEVWMTPEAMRAESARVSFGWA
jgi:hypothetical protein